MQLETRRIEGWVVNIHSGFSPEEQAAFKQAMDLLTAQLKTIRKKVPVRPLKELQKVPIWISPRYPNIQERAEYHPGAQWLKDNGRDPAMAKAVEITNVRIFELETRRMPLFVLHELAHAYHDQVLTNDDPRLLAAYEHARKSGVYDNVLRRDGKGNERRERAYAMTNVQEYFAEGTEGFFGANDFYPFTRAELQKHDPELYALLVQIWR
ncbi:MAG: hypothetical protein QM758_01580 [Armatimonas sp.]